MTNPTRTHAMRATTWLVLFAVMGLGLLPVAAVAQHAPTAGAGGGAQVFVDRSWAAAVPGVELTPGRFAGLNAFATIQSAIDAAAPGGTVNVAAGSYVEQLVIDGKNLTLAGAGEGATTIVSPAVLAISFVSGTFTNKPVILCRNAADIRVRDLTVDGGGQGNVNNRFIGIAFFDAGGGIFDVDVVRIRNTPLDNVQHGFAIYCQNSGSGPFALECSNVDVSDFQKSGFLLNGSAMTVDVHDCTITGSGDLTVIAQNGIQLGTGAGGVIRDCTLSDLRYVPAIAVSAAVLVFQPGSPVSLSGFAGPRAFSNVQSPIRWYNGEGSIDGVEITGPIIQGQDFGTISINNFTASGSTTLEEYGSPGIPPARPVEETVPGQAQLSGTPQALAEFTVDISNLCLVGGDVFGTTGVYVNSTGGPLTVNISQAVIHDWDYGVQAVGAPARVNVAGSSIASNITAAYDSHGGADSAVVESNWWGAASGPSGVGPGSGDVILGTGVDFNPWLLSGTNSATGCGFLAAPEQIDAVISAACLSTAAPCATVDVTITRSTMTNTRGFSIPVQLSPNLQLCNGVSSITEGPYLSAVGATIFQVIDHGGGSYTVDGAILGLPCGATAPAGTLFSLQVAKAPGPDGTGTVTIGAPTLRDCDNGSVAAAAGAAATITIDTAGPPAMTDIAATQVKTGNDTDGTTKTLVTFTPPGDAVSFEVYRAGFGNYPEYDDAPGSGAAPTSPTYPPAAPWVLTGLAASGQFDEIAQRDFWYYVVFGRDACGNVSAVSNRTNGTLNYHLGDVSNGFTPGQGNNSVLAEDISLLGIHYPSLLGVSDPFAYLDVGPTTDLSVNGRPNTDNQINFEDLIVFALNYSLVSAPLGAAVAELPAHDALSFEVPELPAPGGTFNVPLRFTGRGDVQGLSLAFAWDEAVVEPVGIARGELLDRQSRGVVMLPAGAGALDLALLGRGMGLAGVGELARVTFRVIAAGDPAIALERVIARDGDNRPASFETDGDGVPSPALPARTAFGIVAPNPSRDGLGVEFTLATPGRAGLAVFDLSGRRVRTLLDEPLAPGEHRIAWNGRDVAGRRVPAGFYVLRLDAGGVTATRRITIVR